MAELSPKQRHNPPKHQKSEFDSMVPNQSVAANYGLNPSRSKTNFQNAPRKNTGGSNMRTGPNHPSSRPTRQLQQPPPKKINQHESNESEESYESEESDDIDINAAYQQHVLKK